jgi:hypothetical protein
MNEKNKNSSELVELKQLNKRIEVVIALILRSVSRDNKPLPLKEQIAILDALRVRPVEIAEIVGKTSKHVSKELVGIRREAKSK